MNDSASILDVKALFLEQAIVLWRRKWIALAACWMACVVGWTAVMMMPRIYQSNARAYVDVNGLLRPLLKGLVVDTTTAQTNNFLRQTLLSRPNLEQVIHLTGLDTNKTAAQREALIRSLTTGVRVRGGRGRNLFTISYSNPDPVMTKNVVDSLLTIFAEKAATSSRVEMEKAHDFLEDQIAGYEGQLREAEQRRADFRKKYGDYLGDPSSGMPRLQAVQQQVNNARQEYENAAVSKEALEAELKAVPQFRMVDSPTIGADGKIVSASPAVRLAQARAQYQELQLKFTSRHPDVEAAKHRVDELEAQIASREPKTANEGKEQVPNPVYGEIRLKLVQVQTELPAAKQRLDRALALLSQVKDMAADIPDVDAKAKDIDRDYEIVRKNHDELVQRRQAATLSQAADEQADRTQFRIIDPPQIPLRPSFPNFPLMFSLVLLGGIGVGLALPLGIELMRATYASAARLRTLGLPVIGAVTFARHPGSQRGVMIGAAGVIVCVTLLLATYGLLLLTNTAALAAAP